MLQPPSHFRIRLVVPHHQRCLFSMNLSVISFVSLQFFFLQHIAALQLLSGREESGIQRAEQEHRKVSLLSENQLCLGPCFQNEGCLITVWQRRVCKCCCSKKSRKSGLRFLLKQLMETVNGPGVKLHSQALVLKTNKAEYKSLFLDCSLQKLHRFCFCPGSEGKPEGQCWSAEVGLCGKLPSLLIFLYNLTMIQVFFSVFIYLLITSKFLYADLPFKLYLQCFIILQQIFQLYIKISDVFYQGTEYQMSCCYCLYMFTQSMLNRK